MRDDLTTIDGCRALRAELLAELQALQAVHANRDETRVAIERWVSEMADRGAAKLDEALRAVHRGATPSPGRHGLFETDTPANVAALLVSLLGPAAVSAAICARLDTAVLIDSADTADRAAAAAVLERRLLGLEAIEEALISDAEGQGLPVLRRPDADPATVLMPALKLAAAADAALAAEAELAAAAEPVEVEA